MKLCTLILVTAPSMMCCNTVSSVCVMINQGEYLNLSSTTLQVTLSAFLLIPFQVAYLSDTFKW